MRYVVIGAGAVGGVVGGLLAAAGREVVFVARGAHGAAIREHGLLLRLPTRDLRPPATAVAALDDLMLRRNDVVLVAVKSHQSSAVLRDLAGAVVDGDAAGTVVPVFCLQNGIANEDAALREVRGVHGVCVNLPATHLEPGIVDGEGSPAPGLLELGLAVGGHDAVDTRVAGDLAASGFIATVRDDVMAWKRAKLLRNLGNASQALCGVPADPGEREALSRVRSAALAEGRAVFAAAGVAVTDDDTWTAHLAGRASAVPVHGRPRGGGSTWQSLRRGADGVETAFLNGEVVRLGRWCGVATPANELLQAAMARLVHEGGAAGSVAPSDLAARLTWTGTQVGTPEGVSLGP